MKTLEVLDKVLKGKRLKPVTQRHYREALGSLSRYEAEWPVSGIVINEWIASLDGFADSTVKMWFDFVNSAGKYIKMAFKVENPCESAERPKVAKKRRRYFSAEELMWIIKACVEVSERLLVLALVDSTCRIGEIGADREGRGGLFGKNIGEAWINVKGKTGERRYRLDASLCEAMKALGLELYAKSPSNAVTAVKVPEPVDGEKMVKMMRDSLGVAVAGGQSQLKGKIFRIAHMGFIGTFDIIIAISAVEIALSKLGYKVDFGKGVGAAEKVLAKEEAS